MRTKKNDPESNSAGVYQIRVKGMIDPSWSEWLDGLVVIPQSDETTLLVGPIVDQAALQGILNKLHAMNLPLLFVERADW